MKCVRFEACRLELLAGAALWFFFGTASVSALGVVPFESRLSPAADRIADDTILVAQFHAPPPAVQPPVVKPPQIFIPVAPPPKTPPPTNTKPAPETMAAPAQSSASAPVSAKTSSASAPSKKTVRELQQLLKDLGYEPGPVDGLNGGRTTNALYAWIDGLGEEDREKAHDAADTGDYGALTEMMRSLPKVQVATTGTGQNAAGAARLTPASDQTQADDQQEFDEVTSQQLSETWADIAQYNIEQSAQGLIFMDRLKEKAIAEVRDIANSLFGFDDENENQVEITDFSETYDNNVLDNTYYVRHFQVGDKIDGPPTRASDQFFSFGGPVFTADSLPDDLKKYALDENYYQDVYYIIYDSGRNERYYEFENGSQHILNYGSVYLRPVYKTGVDGIYNTGSFQPEFLGSGYYRSELSPYGTVIEDGTDWINLPHADSDFRSVTVDQSAKIRLEDYVAPAPDTIVSPANDPGDALPDSPADNPVTIASAQPDSPPLEADRDFVEIGMDGPVRIEPAPNPEPVTQVGENPSGLATWQELATLERQQYLDELGFKTLSEQELVAREIAGDIGAAQNTITLDSEWEGDVILDSVPLPSQAAENAFIDAMEIGGKTVIAGSKIAVVGGLTLVNITNPALGLGLTATKDVIVNYAEARSNGMSSDEALKQSLFKAGVGAVVNVGLNAVGGGIASNLKSRVASTTGGAEAKHWLNWVIDWELALGGDQVGSAATNAVTSEGDGVQARPDYGIEDGLWMKVNDHGAWNAEQ